MAFSVGAHRCLGSHPAGHELQVMLYECHAAIPDYRVAPGTKFGYHGGSVFALANLALEWDI